MIYFYNVSKQFDNHSVLDNVSFNIMPKELVVLSGTSGAGKSTVVNLLLGADKPDTGSVEVDGAMVSDMDNKTLQSYRRGIGVVHQDYKLLPKLTAFENVAFAMEVCESPAAEIEVRVPSVLHKVGLEEALHKYPHQLSGGERQRLAIARALVHNPRLLIADEPTGNLDEGNIRGILSLFQALNDEGTTILLTTHDPLVREILPARLMKLEKGQIA